MTPLSFSSFALIVVLLMLPLVNAASIPSFVESPFIGPARPCNPGDNCITPDFTVCPAGNNSAFDKLPTGQAYNVVCDIDFPSSADIYPFVLASSFVSCMKQCDQYNELRAASSSSAGGGQQKCAGFVFAPDRVNMSNDCYLKSDVSQPISASICLEGATQVLAGSSVSSASTLVSSVVASSTLASSTSTNTSATSTSSSSASSALTSTSSTSSASSTSVSSTVVSSSSTSTEVSSTTQPSKTSVSTTLLSTVSGTASVTDGSVAFEPIDTSTPATPLTIAGSIKEPNVGECKLHGASVNKPTSQWVEHPPVLPMKLESDLLHPGINCDLITKYDIAGDTGPLTVSHSPFSDQLADLSVIPHLSRDGGKGGQLNGQHLFIFCDTASFTTSNDTVKGEMVGFVSSSVAIDDGRRGLSASPLNLVDGIGQWNDDVGRMRGFSPMTNGEQSFNVALSGEGYRYAVWPMSSLVPLEKTKALQYAALVYLEVNMDNQNAKYTTIGNTLLTISIDEKYGPTAERTVKRMFDQGEIQYGTIAGIRSWGEDGIGGTQGKVWVFGESNDGLLAARVDAGKVNDKDSYGYWTNSTWTSVMPVAPGNPFIMIPAMDLDIFYSPYHRTFITVYLTRWADNTFYYRYLQSPNAIIPAWSPTRTNDTAPTTPATEDVVENILNHPWSDELVLYRAPQPNEGNYIYAGAVQQGYFAEQDITQGGTKILLTWTAKTGQDAASPESGYAHMSASVVLE